MHNWRYLLFLLVGVTGLTTMASHVVRITPTADTCSDGPCMDMSLNEAAKDSNNLYRNLRWVWQKSHPSDYPNPKLLCGDFALANVDDPSKGISFGTPPCTNQTDVHNIDYPFGVHDFICGNFGGDQGSLHGHVNWTAATYEGLLFWKGMTPWYKFGDGDYNFGLIPQNRGALTVWNPEALGIEFDSHETINHFDTPWWNKFHRAVDGDDPEGLLGSKYYAVVVGLVNLDSEHNAHSELHPVYAMAIHVKDDPTDDIWAIFARNWGNEGFCSQDQHPLLGLPSNKLRLFLPRTAVTRATPQSGTVFAPSGITWSLAPVQGGALITFDLGDPHSHPRVNGEIHIKWDVDQTIHAQSVSGLSPKTVSEMSVPSRQSIEAEQKSGTQQRLNDLWLRLPEEKKDEIKARLTTEERLDSGRATQLKPRLPKSSILEYQYHLPSPPANAPRVISEYDQEKAARDRKWDEEICKAQESVEGPPLIPPAICALSRSHPSKSSSRNRQ
jgi:hypothetical protein